MPAAEPSVDKILANFISVVKTEHLVHGSYIDSAAAYGIDQPHPVCNGHVACAVGSLYVAGRVAGGLVLDMVDGSREYRDRRLRHRPNLKKAYRLLDQAAQREAERRGVDLDDYSDGCFQGPLEKFFEGYMASKYGYADADSGSGIADRRTRDELLRLAKNARQQHRRNTKRAVAA